MGAGTSAAIINRMNAEVNKALFKPALQKRLSGLSMEIRTDSTPASAAQWLERETTKWKRTLKDAGDVAN